MMNWKTGEQEHWDDDDDPQNWAEINQLFEEMCQEVESDNPPNEVSRVRFPNNLNRIKMNPQPLLELNQVVADCHNRWGRFEKGKGMVDPLLNQPPCAVGVAKEEGVWYWLLND